MRWYLYAIAGGSPGDLPPGVDGKPVITLVHGDLRLLASRWDERTPPLDQGAVLRHEAVVEAAMEAVTVLPCRFGTLGDGPVCLAFVERNADRIRTRLAKVAGQAEVTLKLLDPARRPTPPGAAPRSGVTYLLRRQQQARREQERAERARGLIEQVDAVLSPWASDRRQQVAPSAHVLAALTYLVPRDAVGAWTQAALALRPTFGDIDLMASGPWPPYHFAEVTDGGQGES